MNEENANKTATQQPAAQQPAQPAPETQAAKPVEATPAPAQAEAQKPVEQPVSETKEPPKEAPQQPAQPVTETAPKEEVKKEEVKTEAAPAPEAKPAEPAPAAQTAPATAPETKPAEPAPSSEAPKPEPIPQPASEPAPKPEPLPQPAQEPAPKPEPVAQPVEKKEEVAPAEPAQTAQPVQPAPAAPATPTPAAPAAQAAPANQDINAGPALNPLANEASAQPAPAAPTAAPTQPTQNTFAPSMPLAGGIDASSIGFVAVGEEVKKKKNKPLIITVTLVLLIVLAAVGYFVLYPMMYRKFLSNPKAVYEAVIKDSFKGISNSVNEVVHSKVIYDLNVNIETNIEAIKDFSGYTYGINLGVDPQNKAIQTSLKLKDISNQEHSYTTYVRDNRQYTRLSNYRELIYNGPVDYEEASQLFLSFQDILDMSNKAKGEDFSYLVDTFAQQLANSIVESKLTKEEASITINGEKIKVLNHKYAIDNETLSTMVKSIAEAFESDDKALEIIATTLGSTKDDVKKMIDGIDYSKKFMKDDLIIYVNIYTLPTKKTVMGIELNSNEDDSYIHWFKKNDYFEIRGYTEQHDSMTGKDNIYDLIIVGKNDNGKKKVVVSLNEKELANFLISNWDENTKDFTYEIKSDNISYTGNIKFTRDVNEDRAKYTFVGTLNLGDEYFRLAFDLTEDWTSEIANINTGVAVTLSEEEYNAKLNEFIMSLESNPLYKMFSTVSGEFVGLDGDYEFPWSNGDSKKVSSQDDVLQTACSSLDVDGYYTNSENIVCENYLCRNTDTGEELSCS